MLRSSLALPTALVVLAVLPATLVAAQPQSPPGGLSPQGQLVLRDEGVPRRLSFSRGDGLLASSRTDDCISVFNVAKREVEWQWCFPEVLSTSLGELLWPWSDRALAEAATRDDGDWKLLGPRKPDQTRGWPGRATALFPPLGPARELAVVHNPCLSNTHVIVQHDEAVELSPGIWLLGAYVHFYGGNDFDWEGTGETEQPEKRPQEGAVYHGLPEVTAAAYSPDGSVLVLGYSDGYLRLIDAAGREVLMAARAEGSDDAPLPVKALDVSPDCALVAAAGESGAVRLFSLANLGFVRECRGPRADGRQVQFSPDGSRLACSARGNALCLFDVATGECRRDFPYPRDLGGDVLFTYGDEGGSMYVAGTVGRSGVVGELDPLGRRLTCLRRPGLRRITALTRSPSGRWLALADERGSIMLWRLGRS